jgi:hypothetical protein
VKHEPCCIAGCYRADIDPHHLMIAQPKARSLTAGDQWTVPLCRLHHDALHARGDERAWWRETHPGLDVLGLARSLWHETVTGQTMP